MTGLRLHGNGSKMSRMQQIYSQHHLKQAHHHGLVAGTLLGSLAVTVVIAVATVVASPELILNPLSFTSKLTNQQPAESAQPGAGVANLPKPEPTQSGLAAEAASHISY